MSERQLFPMIAVAAPLSVAALWFMDSEIDWFVFAASTAFAGFIVNTFYAIGTE